jgi:hypothetical protein
MNVEGFLLILTTVALALTYGACIALVVRNDRIGAALFVSALGVAGSMLLVSLASAWAVSV